ncbi:MAG: flagellar basal body-associated FliL family protein [Deltaproteobacteria bacterium]|nr:flagellar basal body-associated FliL family protein [Deltaproteobacteria bacterium]
MAEKEPEKGAAAAEEGEEEEKKESKIKALLIPVITSAVTAAVVGLVFAFVISPKQGPLPEEAGADAAQQAGAQEASVATQEMLEGGHSGIFHNYDPFIVSIFDREKVHYLKVVLSLELASESIKEEIAVRNPQLRDAMIFVLSDFTLRELLDNQSQNLLKENLVKTVNKILGKGKVLSIYFTEFTIQ